MRNIINDQALLIIYNNIYNNTIENKYIRTTTLIANV